MQIYSFALTRQMTTKRSFLEILEAAITSGKRAGSIPATPKHRMFLANGLDYLLQYAMLETLYGSACSGRMLRKVRAATRISGAQLAEGGDPKIIPKVTPLSDPKIYETL